MKTTAKTNPITGMATDNNPRREARQEKRQVRRDTRALNKSLNEGVNKQGKAKQYYTEVPVKGKTRLESKMEKYGVEPASSKLSPSQQKQFNKNRVKLAKQKEKGEKRQERNANPTKFDTFVMKTLGKGKYDRGNMKRNVVEEGQGGLGYKSKQSKPPSCRGPK